MKVCISGASGFLGSALTRHLNDAGHEVVRLVRRPVRTPDESSWDPANGQIDPGVIEQSDVVVNLSGAPIAHWPWTASYKKELLTSRVDATTTLAETIAGSDRRPALLSGSGVNAYGDDRGDAVLDESSGDGPGVLAEVVGAWEAATAPASDAGARVCHLRTAVVIEGSAAVFRLIALPIRLGVGGRLGSGRQYFSVISRNDWVRAVTFLAEDASTQGAYNLVAPAEQTNADFTKALAQKLHRPAVVPVPAFVLRTVLGDLSTEALGSLRAHPVRLQEAGFDFAEDDLDSILERALAAR